MHDRFEMGGGLLFLFGLGTMPVTARKEGGKARIVGLCGARRNLYRPSTGFPFRNEQPRSPVGSSCCQSFKSFRYETTCLPKAQGCEQTRENNEKFSSARYAPLPRACHPCLRSAGRSKGTVRRFAASQPDPSRLPRCSSPSPSPAVSESMTRGRGSGRRRSERVSGTLRWEKGGGG